MHVGSLLDVLADPFELFPMQSIAAGVAALIDQSDGRRSERSGYWGVSDRYRSVEDDHEVLLVELLIGSTFVLGQTAITQGVSIVQRIRGLTGLPACIPKGRFALMSTEAPVHESTGVSKIVLIDAVANYFKHHHEWPNDWLRTERNTATVDAIRKLGLEPGNERNLARAVGQLGMTERDLTPMALTIQDWRERLAAYIRAGLAGQDL